jgi:Phosphopantetheine attachment site/AMP-binding enzyme C-terminal domain
VDVLDTDDLRRLALEQTDIDVEVDHIPNSRIAGHLAALNKVQSHPDTVVGDLKAGRDGLAAVDPASLSDWAAAAHRTAVCRCSDRPDRFDLFLAPAGAPQLLPTATTRPANATSADVALSLHRAANDPRNGARLAELPRVLRSWLGERLPPYAVPAEIVVLDELPRLANTKLDREGLDAVFSADVRGTSTAQLAPQDDLEQVLVDLFAELVGRDRVGVRDDFFRDLGGHSLLGTRLMARLRRTLRIDLPLRALFLQPTVAGLAATVRADPVVGPRAARAAAVYARVAALDDDQVAGLVRSRERAGVGTGLRAGRNRDNGAP